MNPHIFPFNDCTDILVDYIRIKTVSQTNKVWSATAHVLCKQSTWLFCSICFYFSSFQSQSCFMLITFKDAAGNQEIKGLKLLSELFLSKIVTNYRKMYLFREKMLCLSRCCGPVGPPLWSGLKYFNSYWMDYYENWFIYSCSPQDELKHFCTEFHGSQSMNPNGDSLTFSLASSTGQFKRKNGSNTLVYD